VGRAWLLGCRLALPGFSAGWFQRHLRILRIVYTVVSISVSRVVKVVVWLACCCRKHVVRHRPWSFVSLPAVCWLGVLGKVTVWFFALRLAGFVAILFGSRGWFLCRCCRPVGFGPSAVTVKLSEWFFVSWLSALRDCQSVFLWLGCRVCPLWLAVSG